jgi:hypothetical protein
VTSLVLKRASASRSSGEWNDDDYDVTDMQTAGVKLDLMPLEIAQLAGAQAMATSSR